MPKNPKDLVSDAAGGVVGGAVTAIAKGVETVGGVFTTNKENDAQRAADEQLAILNAYQKEFHHRENRGTIDKIADGFNRMIRPVIVTMVLFIFVVAYISPEHLAKITLAMSSIPDGYWALLSVIIAFYFGGRMQLKSQQFKFNENQMKAVSALIETKKEFRKLEIDTDEPDKLVGDAVAKSAQIDQTRGDLVNAIVEHAMQDNSDEAMAQEVDKLKNETPDAVIKRRRVGPKRFGRM